MFAESHSDLNNYFYAVSSLDDALQFLQEERLEGRAEASVSDSTGPVKKKLPTGGG